MNTSEVKKYSEGLVNSIKSGKITLEEAVIESSTKTGCTKDYARKILNDYLKSGYSNNPDYVGDWFGKGQIDFNAIINPEDDGDVWMVKMWSGSGYTLDVYLCKATNIYDAIDTVFEWSWENEGENNMVFDLDYVYDDARRVFEDDPNYFGSEYDWEDFSDRFIEEFYVANESYDLFCNAENFFVDKVPENVLAENQKPVQNSRKSIKSMARSYLKPEYDSRASFYNKAETDDNKLYSYGTLVAEIKDGQPVLYPDWNYSQTTIRHVREWLRQNGFESGTKADIERMYPVQNSRKSVKSNNKEI